MYAFSASTSPLETQGFFARLAWNFRTQLRRAFELSGAAYENGPLPPA